MVEREPSSSERPSSERLRFREMTIDDLDAMSDLLGDPEVMAHYPRPKTRAEAQAWVEWNLANYARDGFGLWIIEDLEGRFVGDCGLTWQRVEGREDLEIGYHVVPAMQGRGLASEGARACRELARRRGIERLIAIVHPDNRASQRVAEKCGLVLEQEFGDQRFRVYAAALP
ncbi:GNAT family N-acetyltransferase [Nocardioides sp. Soil796]|uniref:GNAT family N-acetyltransferase n=1 Tax=Nocardioides sp. Soil796 TaxID=1736412 RepID=UPI0022866858|nr:GNAT family N-acetyltransferase [Nocardioides sp. Soil796]